MTEKKGAFTKLLEAITEVEGEYGKLPEDLRRKLSKKGFTMAHLNSLTRIANGVLKPMLLGTEKPPAKAKLPSVDPLQMTIWDFLPTDHN